MARQKLTPLWTRGGSSGASASTPLRAASGIAIVSPAFSNQIAWFEDFIDLNSTWATSAIAGTPVTGLISSSATTAGQVQITTSTTANDGGLFYRTLKASTQADTVSLGNTRGNTFLMRCSYGAVRTSAIHGIGFVDVSIARTTDWITDPDVTLANTNSVVITRHDDGVIGDYSGDPQGSIVLRTYTATGGADSLVLVAAGSVGATSLKFELHRPDGTDVAFQAYVGGVLIGDSDYTTPGSAFNGYFSAGVKTTNTTAKNFNIDYVYAEWGSSAGR